MSTFYATFEVPRDARDLAYELLRAGVRPDDLSLITQEELPESSFGKGTVGDATSFVGRDDDPTELDLPSGPDVADKTTTVGSPLMGIDTSDKATNVEMVDQSDDSQTYAESSIQPEGEISQSEHERDDLELAIRSGFPTTVPLQDEVIDDETPRQDQFTDALETIVLPGKGTVIGGGALATAILDIANGDSAAEAIVRHLQDEGMEEERAKQYAAAFYQGRALMAVHTNPGLRDGMLEDYAARHSVQETDLIDAPRFYEGGGQATLR